eukprot:11597133-Alexandrium_andersonii.AAC.1
MEAVEHHASALPSQFLWADAVEDSDASCDSELDWVANRYHAGLQAEDLAEVEERMAALRSPASER